MSKLFCKIFGHKFIVAVLGPNWFDTLCTRCGESHTYESGRIFGHKFIVAVLGPNWFDTLCTRCGESHTYESGRN